MRDSTRCVWTPAQVRELDRIAIEELGIPGYVLMTRAGEAAFGLARARWPDATRWVVLCGAGNNAGDGLVLARLGRSAGLSVTVAVLSDPASLKGDAATAFRDYEQSGGGVVPFTATLLAEAGLVIDALLGTGLERPLTGAYLAAVEAVNASGRPVLALDVPTGLDGLTGRPLGTAIRADLTVTFVGRKLGLFVADGPEFSGQLAFAGLNIPPDANRRSPVTATPALRLFGAEDLVQLLPRRPPAAHKGSFGHVLMIGGNDGMTGAVRLAAESALRAGAGLVTVATRPASAPFVSLARPELMCSGVATAEDLGPLLERATVVACGPGLGRDRWARELFARVVTCPLPLILDADALNLLAEQPVRRDDWVLTPHPGEAGRLLGHTTLTVQSDRLDAVTELTRRYGGTVILKGRCTLVGREGQVPFVIDRGNPGMATAGMGDVLTGLISGLVAQTRSTDTPTVAAAVFIHAAAGDAAAAAGERGLLASDLFPQFRAWLNPQA